MLWFTKPQTIFVGNGVAVLRRGKQHFIEADVGHLTSRYVIKKVSADQAHRAQTSEAEAYAVLMEVTAR